MSPSITIKSLLGGRHRCTFTRSTDRSPRNKTVPSRSESDGPVRHEKGRNRGVEEVVLKKERLLLLLRLFPDGVARGK